MKKVFVVTTLVSIGKRKFLKKYIVFSDSIPKNMLDLGEGKNEEFIQSKQLLHYEVIIK